MITIWAGFIQAVHRLVLRGTFMPVLASGSSTGEAGSSGSRPSHLAVGTGLSLEGLGGVSWDGSSLFFKITHPPQARPTSFTWQPPKRASVDAAERGTQNTTSATFKQVTRPAYTVTLHRDTHAGTAGAVSSRNSLCYVLLPRYIQQS